MRADAATHINLLSTTSGDPGGRALGCAGMPANILRDNQGVQAQGRGGRPAICRPTLDPRAASGTRFDHLSRISPVRSLVRDGALRSVSGSGQMARVDLRDCGREVFA